MVDDRIFIDLQSARRITYPAAVKYLLIYFIFHAGLPCTIGIVWLEGFLTFLAAVALCTIFTVAVLYQIGALTVGAMYLLILFHAILTNNLFNRFDPAPRNAVAIAFGLWTMMFFIAANRFFAMDLMWWGLLLVVYLSGTVFIFTFDNFAKTNRYD